MNYFLYALTGSLCSYFSCINLLPRKPSFKKSSFIFLFTFATFYLLFVPLGQFSTYFALTGILVLSYFFTDKNFFSLSCALFGYLYSVTANHLFLWAAQFLLKMDIEKMLSDSLMTNIFSGIYCLFCITTTWAIGYILHRKLKFYLLFPGNQLTFIIFINLLLLSFFFIFNFSYGEYLGYGYGVIALNGITFLLLFILTAFLMQYIYHFAQKEQSNKNRIEQFENLQKYTSDLEASYSNMRKFKHDYINILSTLSAYLKDDDLDGLKSYYEKQILPLSHSFVESDTELGSLSHIQDSALKGLISFKLIYAMETNITVKIEITEVIQSPVIDILDISRILGVFLDNAIEAAQETSEKEIILCMFYKKACLYIIIENSTVALPYSFSELNKQNVSTKGAHRGLGLYQASSLLNKYPNIIWNTKYGKPYFTQELIIPADKLGE